MVINEIALQDVFISFIHSSFYGPERNAIALYLDRSAIVTQNMKFAYNCM